MHVLYFRLLLESVVRVKWGGGISDSFLMVEGAGRLKLQKPCNTRDMCATSLSKVCLTQACAGTVEQFLSNERAVLDHFAIYAIQQLKLFLFLHPSFFLFFLFFFSFIVSSFHCLGGVRLFCQPAGRVMSLAHWKWHQDAMRSRLSVAVEAAEIIPP